jgi:hypothetical protein
MDHIVAVVDRSGSMGSILGDAEGGLNAYLTEQKEVGEALLTLVEFDDKVDTVLEGTDLKLFEKYTLKPRGMTALFDAVGRTANKVRNTKVSGKKLFVIVTDGHENSSREFQSSDVKRLVSQLEESGWEFLFLAGDKDAVLNAGDWGMKQERSMWFNKSGQGARDGYRSFAAYSTATRMGGSVHDAQAAMDRVVASSVTLSKTVPLTDTEEGTSDTVTEVDKA